MSQTNHKSQKEHAYLLDNTEPQAVWRHFEELSAIPRCSQNEAAVLDYVRSFADSLGLTCKQDSVGNICIKKGASPGYENRPGMIIQGHLDMVCEKNEGKIHDFSSDPLKLIREGDWLRADDTTLGADNGIGVAMALAALEDPSLEHPPLEALLTVDEESGLTGAMALDPSIVDGRILINLDSEDPDAFYIGCAGGMHTTGTYSIVKEKAAPGAVCFKLAVTGLKGGHSGGDIHLGLGNSLRLGGRVLFNLLKEGTLHLGEIRGGSKHNAIPREFFCTFTFTPKTLQNPASGPASKETREAAHTIAENVIKAIEEEFSSKEPGLSIRLTNLDAPETPEELFSADFSSTVIRSLLSIPHGVEQMSTAMPGLVETSSSLAAVWTDPQKSKLTILTSQRSSIMEAAHGMSDRVEAAMLEGGARVIKTNHYPAWTPDPESPFLAACKDVFKTQTGREAKIKAIHAGLECGVIGDKFKNHPVPMQMISFGPEMKEIHTPQERLNIPSVKRTWDILTGILVQGRNKNP